MAVEFRCPDCRAKLKLADAPLPGEDVECPKCGTTFPAPDLDDAPPPPKKKRPPRDENDDAPRPPRKKRPKPAPAAGPKKRRAKQKKSNPYILVGASVGGLLFLVVMVFGLLYILGRKSAAVEMMAYLPDDVDHAYGVNLTQFQKYPKFYDDLDKTVLDPDKKQLEWLSKALGGDYKDLYDYQMKGWKTGPAAGPSAGRVTASAAWVVRTKKEFDPGQLAKIAGAREKTEEGVKYYEVPPDVSTGREAIKVFAPTPRLVVVAPASLAGDKFRKMLGGNKATPEATLLARSGPLGTRTTKGNLWVLDLSKTGKGGAGLFDALITMPSDTSTPKEVLAALNPKGFDASAKGTGFRTNIGAKEMRFEVLAWRNDADNAANLVKDTQYEQLAKGDEAETPPKWWKEIKNNLGDKKTGLQFESNFNIQASGELFVIKSSCDVLLIQQQLGAFTDRARPKPPQP